jgi:hypothetical protein
MSRNHKQVEVKLKCGKVFVDQKIAPLVVWMDSFRSVRTLGSCQGYSPETSLVPMVHFEAHKNDLVAMLKLLPV